MSWKLDFLTYLGFATDCFSDLLSKSSFPSNKKAML
jgi:hypothetical protein